MQDEIASRVVDRGRDHAAKIPSCRRPRQGFRVIFAVPPYQGGLAGTSRPSDADARAVQSREKPLKLSGGTRGDLIRAVEGFAQSRDACDRIAVTKLILAGGVDECSRLSKKLFVSDGAHQAIPGLFHARCRASDPDPLYPQARPF